VIILKLPLGLLLSRSVIDQLYSQVTVCTLPDDILLEVFDFYLVGSYVDAWHTLVHVCKRWRCIVFASPLRLQVRLLCTNKRPVDKTLHLWPTLPIVIEGRSGTSYHRDVKNLAAAFKQHNRVCEINIENISNAVLNGMRTMKMEYPFSALTSLRLLSRKICAPPLSDSFLGGSAPRLQTLKLDGIPFPALANLLFSTHDLVTLDLQDIPFFGYISPEAMVTCLSALTGLQTLRLRFRGPRSRADQKNRLRPRPTRIILLTLTYFNFKGDSEYLEDVVAQIDTPLLDQVLMTFFNQLGFDTPLLRDFICRTGTFNAPHRVAIWFYHGAIGVKLLRRNGNVDYQILVSEIISRPPDWQLSSLAQICDSALSPLPTLERLEIKDKRRHRQSYIENIQWLEVFHPFTSVRDLVLYRELFRLVVPALAELASERPERVTEVLPALRNLFIEGPQPSGPIKEGIGKFIDARQLFGLPVTVLHKDSEGEDYVLWEVGGQ
jgi:F-box-like